MQPTSITKQGYEDFGNLTEYAPNANQQLLADRDQFLWVTHTWDHIDMYCIESNCTLPDDGTYWSEDSHAAFRGITPSRATSPHPDDGPCPENAQRNVSFRTLWYIP